MVWLICLNYLLGSERLPLFGRYGYVRMKRCLMTIILPSLMHLIHAGYLPVDSYVPFMVVSTAYGAWRHVYCFDEGNTLVHEDINYTQTLQQRHTPMVVRRRTAEKRS
jgi:hypothetical protein